MIHLDLQPELEAQLAAEAAARPLDSSTDEARQRILDLAALTDPQEGIRQGLDDLAQGRTRPAREVFDEFRQKYQIPH